MLLLGVLVASRQRIINSYVGEVPEPDLASWRPLSFERLVDAFAPAPFRWWASGGHALEPHLARSWRARDDTNVGIARNDLDAVYPLLLPGAFTSLPLVKSFGRPTPLMCLSTAEPRRLVNLDGAETLALRGNATAALKIDLVALQFDIDVS